MKCPLCGSNMIQAAWTETPFYYCGNLKKCAGQDGIYVGLIRAIRKIKKQERAAGWNEGHRTATVDAEKIFSGGDL
jgi:ssDNA-binding Zn-finger/Zn-ribbon topoisomerase 1